MSEAVTNEALLEEVSKQFTENVDSLDELSRKVSREGLRRVFMIVSRFPYVGDLTTKTVEEERLLTHALYLNGLANEVTKLSGVAEEAQAEVVESVADNIINTANAKGEA